MPHYPRKPLALLIFSLFLFDVPAIALAGTLESIQSKIEQFLRRPGIRSTDWGIEVVEGDNNVLLSVNPDKPFMPASTLKVVTTAAALEKLGPDFRFRTSVYTNGVLQPDGSLAGDLILVGRGDPNLIDSSGELLERPALEGLAGKLSALGIKKVLGDLIGDDSYFDASHHGKGWTAQDLRSTYGAPISALSINNNVFWIHVRPSKVNQRVVVWIEPRTSLYRIRNLGKTGSSGTKQTLYAGFVKGTRTITVSGVLPVNRKYSRHVLLERPAEATAGMFLDELKKRKISLGGAVRELHHGDAAPGNRDLWTRLAEYESPPLIRAMEIINKQSQNLHAEMLLRTLGAEFRGAGTDEAGLEAVMDFVVASGIDTRGVNLTDGCGLSRENLLTPRFQTSLLLTLSTRPYFDLFVNTLAVSGTDGTLKRRLSAKPVRGQVRAKTGTLNGVATLSGYMTTKSGRSLTFSIFANNAAASVSRVQRTIDEICSLFVNLY